MAIQQLTANASPSWRKTAPVVRRENRISDKNLHKRWHHFTVLAMWLTLTVIGGLLLCGWAFGYRCYDVRTPSMGEAAPVGTLIVTKPASVTDIHVGDLITIRPDNGNVTYTHRVVAKTPNGVKTKGDVNGAPDGWTLTQANIVGKVVQRIWGGGWVARGAPFLILGWTLVTLVTRIVVRQPYRHGSRVVGFSLVFTIVALWLQPWVKAVLMGQIVRGDGLTGAVISTGALPITVVAQSGGASVDLRPGQMGSLFSTHANEKGIHIFLPHPNPTGWWAVGIASFVLFPVVYTLVLGWCRERKMKQQQDAVHIGYAVSRVPTSAAMVRLIPGRLPSSVPKVAVVLHRRVPSYPTLYDHEALPLVQEVNPAAMQPSVVNGQFV